VYILFYNKKIFRDLKVPYPKSPMSWSDFANIAKVISSKNTRPKIWGGYMGLTPQSWYMQAIQKGSKLEEENLINFEMALKYRMELENSGVIPKYSVINKFNMHENTEFKKGFVAMHVTGDWHIQQLLLSKINFDWDVLPAPYPQDGDSDLSIGNYSIACINTKTKNFDEAYKFVSFLASIEGSKMIAKKRVLPGYIDDEIATFYSKQFNSNPKNAIAVAKQNFVLEYPAWSKGYSLAYITFEEAGRQVLNGEIGIDKFREKIYEKTK
jgi:ABC-type glycerol-3-phosphate transport system substrate-binding protein